MNDAAIVAMAAAGHIFAMTRETDIVRGEWGRENGLAGQARLPEIWADAARAAAGAGDYGIASNCWQQACYAAARAGDRVESRVYAARARAADRAAVFNWKRGERAPGGLFWGGQHPGKCRPFFGGIKKMHGVAFFRLQP